MSSDRTQPLGYHLIMRLSDGRVIASSVAQRRTMARTMFGTCAGARLLAWRCADTHLHLELANERAECGRLARRIANSLRGRLSLPVAFERTRFRPIESQRHAYHAFEYIFDQEPHHGTNLDPLFEASNLPDLLGLRVTGGFTAEHVRALLPRVAIDELWRRLDSAEQPLPSPAALLGDSAAAAIARPALRGRDAEVVLARAAAVRVAGAQLRVEEIARALGVSPRTVVRLRRTEPPAQLTIAVHGQLALRRAAAERCEAAQRKAKADWIGQASAA